MLIPQENICLLALTALATLEISGEDIRLYRLVHGDVYHVRGDRDVGAGSSLLCYVGVSIGELFRRLMITI